MKQITKTVYHGSSELFEEFSSNEIGKNGVANGRGYYFTDNKEYAKGYATNWLYTASIELRKELSKDSITINASSIRELVLKLMDDYDILSNYNDVEYYGINKVLQEAINSLLLYEDNDVDIINEIIGMSDYEPVMEFIAELGYNYTAINLADETHYIMFDSNDITILDVK